MFSTLQTTLHMAILQDFPGTPRRCRISCCFFEVPGIHISALLVWEAFSFDIFLVSLTVPLGFLVFDFPLGGVLFSDWFHFTVSVTAPPVLLEILEFPLFFFSLFLSPLLCPGKRRLRKSGCPGTLGTPQSFERLPLLRFWQPSFSLSARF